MLELLLQLFEASGDDLPVLACLDRDATALG